jgi:hypothetical protein
MGVKARKASAKILERVVGQIQHDAAGEDAEYVNANARPAEGDAQDEVKQKQQQQQAGYPHGTEAQPLFHFGEPFHRIHDAYPVELVNVSDRAYAGFGQDL